MQRKSILTIACLLFFPISARALDTIEAYIRAYPNQEQARMMNEWLVDNQAGQLSFTGLVDPTDKTVDALMKLDLPAGVDVEIKLQ